MREQAGEDAAPGVPLPSGFDYRPVSEHPELVLSGEARDQVLRMMDDSEQCRARAAIAAQTYVICGYPRPVESRQGRHSGRTQP